MSDKSERPEPVLQPMRIVDAGPAIPAAPVDVTVTPNIKKKPAVMSKKLYEQMKAKAPQAIPQRQDHEIAQTNLEIISNLDRNAKAAVNDNQEVYTDEKWLSEIGGQHVLIAWLQTPVSISGFVSSETTFSSQKIRGLTMSWKEDGLYCKIDNTNGVKLLLIPTANVKCLSL